MPQSATTAEFDSSPQTTQLVGGLPVTPFAYRHVEYSDQLWWEFAYRGDAPRSLRALLAAAVVFALVAVAKLLRPHPVDPSLPTAAELAGVELIVADAQCTIANLALLGDKRFLFSDDRKAVAMFGCEGRSWITMSDPIGPEKSADDAAWKFREACDVAGVVAVFYQVNGRYLARYIEMGMTMLKIGEEGRVPLKKFSLEGSHRKALRRTKKKSDEAGLKFKIVTRAGVAAVMPRLKEISDAWLKDKSSSEKGFSLGFFDEDYLARYDIAVIVRLKPIDTLDKGMESADPKLGDVDDGKEDPNEEIIAFANILRGASKHELSIDLMRYLPDAPHGVMELLFLSLMLYGRSEGFSYFSLGMAPLSGVDSHRLSPRWNRMSNLIFRHGEHFYNFQGLRAYKDKFDPEWSPRYLAAPGGLTTARALTDVATLISGGIGEMLHR